MVASEFDLDDFLSRTTVGDDLRVTVDGRFSSELEARELHSTVFGFVKLFGSVFDLTALDAVSIADDYSAALAAVERGYPGMGGPVPTSDAFGAGFAMAVPVLRNGEHKSHVVLDSSLVRPVVDPEHPYYAFAIHTLCHELAHVYDHMLRVRAMPKHYGTSLTDLREAVLTQFAMAAWDEYAASRLSADWGTAEYASEHEKSLLKMLASLLERSEPAKKAFDEHRDVEKTMAELRTVFETFFVRCSYLIGHIDGLGRSLEEEAPRLDSALCSTTWLKPLWDDYVGTLRAMFERIQQWDGVEEYDALKKIGERLLLSGGMGFVKLPNGLYFVGFNPTNSL